MNMKYDTTYKQKDILEDKSFQKFLEKNKTLSAATIKNYRIATMHFCNANQMPFHELIKTIKREQTDKIIGNEIIKYDPDYASIDDYQYTLVTYLQSKNVMNTTIDYNLDNLRTVLSKLKIELPSKPKLLDDKKPWYPLNKSEIKYCMGISSFQYATMMECQADLGWRIFDIVSKKVGDFMESTYDSHECDEVEEFLLTAPKDMVGFWEFYPNKTKRNKTECKVPSPPWLNNHIMRMLHERVKYFERKGLKMEKEDALFGNRVKQFKGHIKPGSVSNWYNVVNQRLTIERTRVLNQKLKNGEITRGKHHKLIQEAPKFHSHGLRKYFISTLRKNRVHLSAAALMEGHAPPMKNDPSYAGGLKEWIIEEYQRCYDDFNFEDTKIDFTILHKMSYLKKRIKNLKMKYRILIKILRGK